jgi:parvulin-like peptidyl-prolyl isomerase
MGRWGSLGYASPAVRSASRSVALLALAAGLGLLSSACQSTSTYAAIVNGSPISDTQFHRELSAIGDNQRFVSAYDQSAAQAAQQGQSAPPVFQTGSAASNFSQGFAAQVLETDIRAEIIHQEVERLHLVVTKADMNAAPGEAAAEFGDQPTFDAFNSWFRHVYEVRAAEEAVLSRALPPVGTDAAAVKQFYDDHPQDFVASECVSHILVSNQQQAQSLRAKILAGASFAALARKYSTDTSSAAKGGVLGCNPPGQYVAPFEAVADTIAVNAISPPVHSQFGWHIIKVTSRQVTPLNAQTSTEIQQTLQQETPVTAYFDSVQNHLQVQVNVAYGSWDPSEGVVPPLPPPATSGLPTTTTTTPGAAASPASPASPATP